MLTDREQKVMDRLIEAYKQREAEGDPDVIGIWSCDLGLYPLRDWSATFRALERKELVGVSGNESDRAAGWGRLLSLTQWCRK